MWGSPPAHGPAVSYSQGLDHSRGHWLDISGWTCNGVQTTGEAIVLITLANATDLSIWANRVAATADLPDMIRRLLLTTVNDLGRLHFRAGEGTRYPGWDGVVDCVSGNAYIPVGSSVWEMGVDRAVKAKA